MNPEADELAARLERIKALTDQLLAVQDDSAKVRKVAQRISDEIEKARKQVRNNDG